MDDHYVDIDELIKKLPPDPTVMRRMFLLVIRNHFSHPENYRNMRPLLEKFIYHQDDNIRTLDVELGSLFDPKKLPKRTPTIFVNFGAVNFKDSGTGNHGGYSEDNATESVLQFAEGQFSILVVSLDSDEGGYLASQVTNLMMALTHVMCNNSDITYARVIGMSDPQLLKESPERAFVSSVTGQVSWEWHWKLYMEGLLLKKVNLGLISSPDKKSVLT